MNKLQRMEFLLERMKDGKEFTSNKGGDTLEILNIMLGKEEDYYLSIEPLHSFTDDEKVIMKHLPYPYLVRSGDGHIINYEKRPMKYTGDKFWFNTGYELYFVWLDHLFPTIKFENKESVNRKDYL